MTLLPSMRSTPTRDLRMENHKRGRSVDSGLTMEVKDNDLVLFSDMQMRESENFLLNSSEDFDDSLSTIKYTSDLKLQIPVHGDGSDLLSTSSGKNDYDWLLTPPETPLFRSLDDEELQSVCSVSRGRSRAHAADISSASSTGKGQKTSRSSASPIRSTPSSQLVNKQSQGRGRQSLARSASPASVLRSATTSRRSTTPQNRSLTPTQRSSTPTHRRTSSGSSSSVASFGKATRGSSASPKLRGQLVNFSDLSSEVPPNLRTSLSDWSAARARESSPCRNGLKVSLLGRRQSLSPSASRSVSSSQSNDRDHFSSSCDDDVDFTYPVNLRISAHPGSRSNENSVSRKNQLISKKPYRSLSSDLSPSGSLGQMHRSKNPHNMFRPLLSSVPASSFHVTKSTAQHHSLFSWNSSMTTSSNANSDQGASIATDNDGIDHDRSKLAIELDSKIPIPELHTTLVEVDEAGSRNAPKGSEKNIEIDKVEQQTCSIGNKSGGGPSSEVESAKKSTTCPKCDEVFQAFEFSGGEASVCPKCVVRDESAMDQTHSSVYQETLSHVSESHVHNQCVNLSISESLKRSHLGSDVLQNSHTRSNTFSGKILIIEPASKYLPHGCRIDSINDKESKQNLRDDLEHQTTGENFSEFYACGPHHSSIDTSSEGAAVPLVGQRMPHSAATVSCVKPSLSENCRNILKGSEYSSVNLVLPVHSESTSCVQTSVVENCEDIAKSSDSSFVTNVLSRQNKSNDMDYSKVHVKNERSLASFSAESSCPKETKAESQVKFPSSRDKREYLTLESGIKNLLANPETGSRRREENFDAPGDLHGGPLLATEEQDEKALDQNNTWNYEPAISIRNELRDDCPKSDIKPKLKDSSATVTADCEGHILVNTFFPHKGMPSRTSVSPSVQKSGTRKKTLPGSSLSMSNVLGSLHCSSSASEKGKLASRLESDNINEDNTTSSDAIVRIHGLAKRNMCRSLTLDEAADSVLFCSSIIHDLAFKAVSIGMERENSKLASQPPSSPSAQAVAHPSSTLLAKSTFEERNQTPRTCPSQKQVKRSIPQEVVSDLRQKPPMVKSKCNCIVM